MTSKIHRATVTQADLDYVGSITVDADLLDAADLLPGERVDICDCTNGSRLSTYVIPGERGRGFRSRRKPVAEAGRQKGRLVGHPNVTRTSVPGPSSRPEAR